MIGLVGPGSALEELTAAAAGVETRRGSAAEVIEADPAAIIAVGERAVIELVNQGVDCPILPVDAGSGMDAVDLPTAEASLDRLDSGDLTRRARPIMAVWLGDELAGTAVFDAMLVTSEPARISEFAVAADGPIDRFRADGVVVATPAGSHGYAGTAGGPTMDTGADILTVVPVAAFTTRTGVWVADPPLRIDIERDEGGISLILDDREWGTVPNDRTVEIAVTDHFETVAIDG